MPGLNDVEMPKRLRGEGIDNKAVVLTTTHKNAELATRAKGEGHAFRSRNLQATNCSRPSLRRSQAR
jgi:hypothetical protein